MSNTETRGAKITDGEVVATKPGAVRVRFDDLDGLVSDWLPVAMRQTGKNKAAHMMDVGEQVSCLMDNNYEAGHVIGSYYDDKNPPPVTDPDVVHQSFPDGSSMSYNRATSAMTISGVKTVVIQGSGSVTLDIPDVFCTGKLTVQGLLTFLGGMTGSGGDGAKITGNVNVDGKIMATNDILAGLISLLNHLHGKVAVGGAKTDKPE